MNVEIKLKKNIDYKYYFNKVMNVMSNYKKCLTRINVAKTVYIAYKYTNDHFDIIVNNKSPFNENTLSIMYEKVEEYIINLKEILLSMLVSKEKLFRNILKQLYKYYSKYEEYRDNRMQNVKNVLLEIEVKNNIPNDIIKYEIMQYLGI